VPGNGRRRRTNRNVAILKLRKQNENDSKKSNVPGNGRRRNRNVAVLKLRKQSENDVTTSDLMKIKEPERTTKKD
jgi:hypothetical protein